MIFTIYQQGDLDDHLGGVQLIYAGLNAPEGMCNIEHKYRLLKDAILMKKKKSVSVRVNYTVNQNVLEYIT